MLDIAHDIEYELRHEKILDVAHSKIYNIESVQYSEYDLDVTDPAYYEQAEILFLDEDEDDEVEIDDDDYDRDSYSSYCDTMYDLGMSYADFM